MEKRPRSKWAASDSDEDKETRSVSKHAKPLKRLQKAKSKLNNSSANSAHTSATVIIGPARPVSAEQEDISKYFDQEVGGDASHKSSTISHPTPRHPQPSAGPALRPCRHVDGFVERLNRINEGTYGVVYRVRDTVTGRVMAVKRLKSDSQVVEQTSVTAGGKQQQLHQSTGFPITSLREITILLQCRHPNIVSVREIATGSSLSDVFMVMEFVEHDLRDLLEYQRSPLSISEVKQLMLQLLSAVEYLHSNHIVHRDLKTSNLLLTNDGQLKLADFGLARRLADYSDDNDSRNDLTPLVVTLWYRSPELLLGSKRYGFPVDMWSVGCVMAELITGKPLFPGQSELEQLNLIFKMLGTPTDQIWPGFSSLPHCQTFQFAAYPATQLQSLARQQLEGRLSAEESGIRLLLGLLEYDPAQRLTATEALNHRNFSEPPLPKHPSMFPSWPSKNRGDRLPPAHAIPASPERPPGHRTDSSGN